MKQDSLAKFVSEMRRIWGHLDSNLIMKSQALLEQLAKAPESEPWLSDLKIKKSGELYRDPERGFILVAHTGEGGIYRMPHDHGNGWVIYAVQDGEMEMGTYGYFQNEHGEPELVRREKYRVSKGQSRVYLPGDIHDTRCLSESALILRLTSCDLEVEKQSGRMRQYADPESSVV